MDELSRRLAALSPEKRALLERRLGRSGGVESARERPVPLTAEQERMWLLAQWPDSAGALHLACKLTLRGPLVFEALARAALDVAGRHPILATRFILDGGAPVMVPGPEPVHAVQVTSRSDAGDLEAHVRRVVSRPFELAAGESFRIDVVPVDREHHVVTVVLHHLVTDEPSMDVLVRDLEAAYVARAAGRSPTLAAAGDFRALASREHAQRRDGVLARARAWWRGRLDGLIGADLGRPAGPPVESRADRQGVRLPAELVAAVTAQARAVGVTPFAWYLAAVHSAWCDVSGGDRAVLGTVVSDRGAAERDVVGPLVRTLPMGWRRRDGTSFVEQARIAHAWLLDGIDHRCPFSWIVEDSNAPRRPGRHPLVQVSVVQRGAPRSLRFGTAAVELEELESPSAVLDAQVMMVPRDGALDLTLQHRTDAIDAAAAARLVARLRTVLEASARDPGGAVEAVPLVAVPATLAGPTTAVDHSDVLVRIAHHARNRPDASAVEDAGGVVSYHQLVGRAEALAGQLRARGVGRGTIVAVCLDEGARLIEAVLAVLACGAAYLPIDRSAPEPRRRQLLAATRAQLLIDGDVEVSAPPLPLTAVPTVGADLAYVIHTSGSTGTPKAVMVTREAVANVFGAVAALIELDAADRWLSVTRIGFDIAALELLMPLTAGAAVVVAAPDMRRDPARLAALLAASGATVMQATPTTWHMLIEAGWPGRRGLRILCGGEAASPALAAALAERVDACWNVYGPTETTIWSTAAPLAAAQVVSIGSPLANTTCQVLDRSMRQVSDGALGELYLGGSGLARGYHGRPAATAERFVPDPFGDGARLYRTGDLVRRHVDGALEVIGRTDRQVKVRGHRIELAEIEHTLNTCPGARQAVVIAAGDGTATSLIAAVTGPVDEAAVRDHLRARLPEAMVPQRLVVLDALPVTANGKIDRTRLLALAEPAVPAPRAGPSTAMDQMIATLWEQVLGRAATGIDDDFFAAGGHSLLAVRLAARLRETTGLELDAGLVFEHPTIARLAARLAAGRPGGVPPPRHLGRGRYPLSSQQEELWRSTLEFGRAADTTFGTVVRLRGALDRAALTAAVAQVSRRHEALRTHIRHDQDGLCQIVDCYVCRLDVVDLRVWPDGLRDAELERSIRWYARRPLDPGREAVRAALLILDEHEHVFVLAVHHLIADGWSLALLCREITAHYQRRLDVVTCAAPPPPLQYGDVVAWQLAHRAELIEPPLARWCTRLGGRLPPIRFGPHDGGGRGFGRQLGTFDRELAAAVRRAATSASTTVYLWLLTAFEVVIHAWSDAPEVRVATAASGRTLLAFEEVVGPFATTVVVRHPVTSQSTFLELAGTARTALALAQADQDVGLSSVLRALWHTPDFDPAQVAPALFVYQAFASPPPLPGLEVVLDAGDQAVAHDLPEDLASLCELALEVFDDGKLMQVILDHARAAVPATTAIAMFHGLVEVLRATVVRSSVTVAELVSAVRPDPR